MANDWLWYGWLGVMTISTVITVYTDCRWYWIPHGVIAVVAVANGFALAVGLGETNWLLACLVSGAMGAMYLAYPKGMGSGDVFLTAALSLACPALTAYVMVVVAFGMAAVIGALAYLWRRRVLLPFGPFLWGGWWVAFFKGVEVMAWFGW